MEAALLHRRGVVFGLDRRSVFGLGRRPVFGLDGWVSIVWPFSLGESYTGSSARSQRLDLLPVTWVCHVRIRHRISDQSGACVVSARRILWRCKLKEQGDEFTGISKVYPKRLKANFHSSCLDPVYILAVYL